MHAHYLSSPDYQDNNQGNIFPTPQICVSYIQRDLRWSDTVTVLLQYSNSDDESSRHRTGSAELTNSPLQAASGGARHYKSSQNQQSMSRSPSKQKQTGATCDQTTQQNKRVTKQDKHLHLFLPPRSQTNKPKEYERSQTSKTQHVIKIPEQNASSIYIGAPCSEMSEKNGKDIDIGKRMGQPARAKDTLIRRVLMVVAAWGSWQGIFENRQTEQLWMRS